MPRTCTICAHERRRQIDWELCQRTPFRAIACQYGVGRESLRRHAAEHLPALLAKAYEAEEIARAGDLLRDIKNIRAHTIGLLMRAEDEDDRPTLIRAIREARENVRLMGEVLGKLDTPGAVNVTIHMHPEWIELRTAILVALEPHPEARGSVLRALEEVSNGHARG